MEKIEVLFEFKEIRTIICCERVRIPEQVEQQISRIAGIESPKVFVLASRGRKSTTTQYYLLQRWVNKWKSYINVDSLEQLRNEDRLSVRATVLVNGPDKETDVSRNTYYIAIGYLFLRWQGAATMHGYMRYVAPSTCSDGRV